MERESLILERDRHIMNREEVQLLGFEIAVTLEMHGLSFRGINSRTRGRV